MYESDREIVRLVVIIIWSFGQRANGSMVSKWMNIEINMQLHWCVTIICRWTSRVMCARESIKSFHHINMQQQHTLLPFVFGFFFKLKSHFESWRKRNLTNAFFTSKLSTHTLRFSYIFICLFIYLFLAFGIKRGRETAGGCVCVCVWQSVRMEGTYVLVWMKWR